MKKVVMVVPVLALALSGTTACATKKFVRTSVGEVNSKVDTLSKSVEENQERTKANEARIAEVDQRATAAAAAADQKAGQAGQRADAAYSAAEAVNTKADALEKASKRLVYEVVLSATIPRLVRRDRLVLAVADDVDPVERHLVLLVDVALHRFGALQTEAVVGFRRSR